MEHLYANFNRRIKQINTDFIRYLMKNIDWGDRLIAIVGVRGSGKTTLMLQYIKGKAFTGSEALYISLDDIWFSQHSLVDFTEDFVARGGKFLFLDEVHKYPTWSIEIKNIYDNYPDLKIVFTGSSMIEIYKGQGDLSRRLSLYTLSTLSLREYLIFEHGITINPVHFSEILTNHTDIAFEISQKVKPLAYFSDFLKYGSLPFFKENKDKYHERLNATINIILESDLQAISNIDYAHILKLKKLLMVISSNVPFKPNISQLAGKIETERHTLYKYLDILERAGLIMQLSSQGKGLNLLAKAEKVYLGNPNLCYALCNDMPQTGNLRETFFVNQVRSTQTIHYTEPADFIINQKYTIEVGGKGKDTTQLRNTENAFLAIDGIEMGTQKRIPLWLFGFMY